MCDILFSDIVDVEGHWCRNGGGVPKSPISVKIQDFTL